MTAKKPAAATPTITADPLVGRCFVTFNDGKISHQGIVVSRAEPNCYLVQFFDWFVGAPSTLALTPVETFVSKNLHALAIEIFENADHLRFWLEHGRGAQLQRKEDQQIDAEVEAQFNLPAGTLSR